MGEVSDGVDSISWSTRTNTTARSKIITPARPMTTNLSVLFMIALPYIVSNSQARTVSGNLILS